MTASHDAVTTQNTVDVYLERLPHGLDSYPECQSKASGFRHVLATRPFAPEPGRFPPIVEKLLLEPPPASSWVPTVHFHCVMSAIRESLFPGPGGDAPFFQFMRDKDREFFHRPMYRIAFFLTSPKRLLVGLEKRWHQFNRGTDLELVESGERIMTLALTHPPFLFAPDHDRGWAGAMQVAVECAGGREPVASWTRIGPTRLHFRAAWH